MKLERDEIQPRRVVFLDIDGVLNSVEFVEERRKPIDTTHDTLHVIARHKIDPEAVHRLNRLVETTKAKVVLSSAWRYWMTTEFIQEVLEDLGFVGEIIDATLEHEDDGTRYDIDHGRRRLIDLWLKGRDDIDAFVVLDDDLRVHDEEHFVRTDYRVGLLDKDVDKAIELFNSQLTPNSPAETKP